MKPHFTLTQLIFFFKLRWSLLRKNQPISMRAFIIQWRERFAARRNKRSSYSVRKYLMAISPHGIPFPFSAGSWNIPGVFFLLLLPTSGGRRNNRTSNSVLPHYNAFSRSVFPEEKPTANYNGWFFRNGIKGKFSDGIIDTGSGED